MATSDELRQQIQGKQRELQDKHRLKAQLLEEVSQANERQRLRRELERVQEEVDICSSQNAYIRFKKACIDRDTHGDHLPDGDPVVCPRMDTSSPCISTNDGQVLNCGNAVTKGEYRWKLEGLSWLEHTLRQSYSVYLESDVFRVGDEDFLMAYHPRFGVFERGSHQQGSLVLIHQNDEPDDGITFRYKFFIKEGENWVQWGSIGDECHPDGPPNGRVFGPDVQMLNPATKSATSGPFGQFGIFGQKHKDLLQSEWVVDDSLTVKVELEVRSPHDCARTPLQPAVTVPSATMTLSFLGAIESGKYSDITFLVEGKPIQAHSQILGIRSDYFDRLLNAGMRESATKEIAVEDCSHCCFKALLQFLYTDDFSFMEELVKSSTDTNSSSSSSDGEPEQKMSLVQCLLAASHKYEVPRLTTWCEQQLCGHITASKACSLLTDAYLYGAKQLEEACLIFIKQNMALVAVTPEFASLCKDWPDVMLKLSRHSAGVPEPAVEPQAEGEQQASDSVLGKRKREE